MKFAIVGRPPTPGNHAAGHRSDCANEHRAQDVRELPSWVQQSSGAPGEQADRGEYKKVPHGLFSLMGRFQSFSYSGA